MILLWVVLVVSALLTLGYAAWLAADVTEVSWPEETPLRIREERARDQRLTQLARLVRSHDLQELDRVVAALAGRLGDDARDDPVVRRFLDAPPLTDPDRYRRQLATVLTRLEAT